MRCYFSERYVFELPEKHPFPIEKYRQTRDLLLGLGIISSVHDPGMVGQNELRLAHEQSYIDAIFEGSLTPDRLRKLGFPWSKQLVERSRSAVAGTLEATKFAVSSGLGINLAGGTHHAFPDNGYGYCVFNDVAVAANTLLNHNSPRIMVVDVDAHQGNGTHFIFSNCDKVYTYSVHVGKNYPRNKHPGTCDIELERWVDGKTYLDSVKKSLELAVDLFSPDVAFYLAGVDVHEGDRFGQMSLKTEDIEERDRWILGLLNESGTKVVVVLGGGYNKDKSLTSRMHARTVEIALDTIKN